MQISWILVTFPKIYLGLIFWFFFSKFDLVSAVSVLFHEQVLYFMYAFCWNNEYILDNISYIWVQKV